LRGGGRCAAAGAARRRVVARRRALRGGGRCAAAGAARRRVAFERDPGTCYAVAASGEAVRETGRSRGAVVRRAWGVVRRAWGVMRRALDKLPPTVLGLLFAAAASIALFDYGLGRIDLVLLVCGAVALGVWALLLLIVVVTAIVLFVTMRRQVTAAPVRGEAGYPRRTTFTAPVLRFVPLLRCRWHWVDPAEAVAVAVPRGGRQEEEVTPTARWRVETVERRMVVEDVLGLMRVAWRHKQCAPMCVLPNVGQFRQMPVIRALAGGEDLPLPMGDPVGDRVDYRRYGPGDPLKTILWKTFARTRQVMVRTPERAIAPAQRTVVYLVAAPWDEPAAAAARVAIEVGILGANGRFGTDGQSAAGTADPELALEWIAGSVAARHRCGADLEPFLREAERLGRVRGIIFVPAAPGPWLDRVAGVVAGRCRMLDVVVATDGVELRAPSWLHRLVLKDRPARTLARAELDETIRRLLRVGVEPIIVERHSGKVYGLGHLRAMRA
jgi:hypothetical protein